VSEREQESLQIGRKYRNYRSADLRSNRTRMRRFSRITEQRTTNTLTITVMLKLKMKGYCIEGVEAYWMKHVSRVSWSIGTYSFLLIEPHGCSSVGPPPCNYISPCSLSTSPSLLPPGSIPVPVYSNKKHTQTRTWPPHLHPQRPSSRSSHPAPLLRSTTKSRTLPMVTQRHSSSTVAR